MTTGKLKVLLADRFSWCEQSAKGVKCQEADAAVHVVGLKCVIEGQEEEAFN